MGLLLKTGDMLMAVLVVENERQWQEKMDIIAKVSQNTGRSLKAHISIGKYKETMCSQMQH